jgi:hypothetical protein
MQRSSPHLKSGPCKGSDCLVFPHPGQFQWKRCPRPGKYQLNRSFFENTRFNQNKTMQNSSVLNPFLVVQVSLSGFRDKVAPKPAVALIVMDEKIWVLIAFFGKKPVINRFFL